MTGASGFIGRALVPRLVDDGWLVHGVGRHTPADLAAGIVWHAVDILDRFATDALIAEVRPSHLLHLAWITTPGVYWTSPDNQRWVGASLALAEAFCDAGGTRMVVAGTCAEYVWRDEACREGVTPLEPATPYGKAKLMLFRELARLCKEHEVEFAWGRIFHLYGPHEHPARLVPSVICNLLAGKEARTTGGQQVRGFLHVTDVADAFVSLLAGRETGAFNIGSSEPVRIADLVLTIADLLDARDRVQLGALPTSPDDPPLLIANNDRLKDAGWEPKIPLAAGLADAIASWRDRCTAVGSPP